MQEKPETLVVTIRSQHFPFPIMYSKSLFLMFIKTRDCVVPIQLTLYQTTKFWTSPNLTLSDSSKPKEFADDNFKSYGNIRNFYEREENTV